MDNYTDIRDFYSLDSMVEHAVDNIRFDKSDYFTISIIANQTIAENIIRILISNYNCKFGIFNFDNVDYGGDYIISLTKDMELYCQPDYQENGNRYITEADIIYVHEDVKADVLNGIEADEIIIFGIK